MTIRKRSAALHAPSGGDLFIRFIGCSLAATFICLSLFCTLWFCQGAITNTWNWNRVLVQVLFPTALWLTATYVAVVRFLSYLDLRIRREGWEVQLQVQAAAAEFEERFA